MGDKSSGSGYFWRPASSELLLMKSFTTLRRRFVGALCLFALLAPVAVRAADLKEGDLKQWALLAIQDNGRRKPIDTFAQESLLRITGRDSFKSLDGRSWQPNELLLSALLDEARDWRKEPIILINFRPLVKELGLDPERKRYSFEELTQLKALENAAKEIHALRLRDRDAKLDRRQQEIESVSSRLGLLGRMISGQGLLIAPPSPISAAVNPAAAMPAGHTANDGHDHSGPMAASAMMGASANPAKAPWLVPPDAATIYGDTRFAPISERLRSMVGAYHEGNTFKFNLQARELREKLRELNPKLYPSDKELEREYLYNHLNGFSWAATLYIIGLITLTVSCFVPSAQPARMLRWAGILCGVTGLALHGTGLALRCLIAGRPPVTNMYESMVWVAFVIMAFGFAFFLRYRGVTYLLAAMPVSALALLAVMQAPVAMPESIDPLVPVLRDNFWLTIHVLTITASYGAFALGMGFGHILLFRYLLDPAQARGDSVLHFWLYRILQLGVLLIASGTILGGVWANYSWGRFWGWDPKETWAFITLLCYIVSLHGRIAGWWGQFGMAVASVVCFAAVLMAWYGVNLLGKGLHSYGHTFGGEIYVVGFVALDMIFLATVCWRHLQSEAQRRLVVSQ
jgi:cytochrome c-type biogenesis protein CcsB